MNPRIRELAEQARKEFLELPTGYSPEQVGMYPQLIEKFAELIVKETMQVVANNLPQNTYIDVAHAVIEHYTE